MDKKTAKASLDATRAEIAELEGDADKLRRKLSDIMARLTELRTVAHYFARLAGDTAVASPGAGTVANMTLANAAAVVMSPGEQLPSLEIANRILAAGHPYASGPRKMAMAISTVLARDTRFERVRPGHWALL